MDVDGSPEQLAALSSSSAAEDPEVTAQAPPTENQKKEKEEEVEVDAGAEEEEQEKATRKSRGAKSNRRKRRRGKGTAESVEQAEEEIRIHEWNLDAWQTLFSHGLNLGVPRGRVFLDRTVEKFPLAARFWKAYVELEMSAQNYDVVEALFEKCLKKCPDVELWSSYLRYVRIVKDGEEDANIVMKSAFDLAIDTVGQDSDSYPIWREYVSFLKAQPATLPFQQGEKLTMIRKVYQQAVVLPLTQVDTLWKEYEAWETSNNRDLAKEIISKLIQKHQTAKQVRRDRRKFQDYLLKHLVSRPLHCIGAYEGARIKRQLLLWKQLLEYEMTNPLRLEPEALKKRVSFNFRQCISCLLHCPEVWYEYAMFYLSQKSAVDARRVLREGMDFLHQSILMHLIFATFEESMKNFKDAKKIYELCISRNPHPLMFIQYMRFCRRIEGIAAARKAFIAAAKREDCDHRVFVAAALMELRLNKEPQIASRIFNNGLKKFSKNADFMMEYIKFLHQINDHNNMRVVIEQALNELPKEESHEVWKTLLALQYETADLSGIEEIERRYSSFFGIKEGSFNLISRRFSFESLIPEEISALGTSDDLHSNIEMKLPPSPIRGRSFVPPNRARMLKFNPMGMGPDNGMIVNRDEGKFFLPRVPIGPLIVNLLNQLPPRMEFWNQAVDSEQLMRLIASLRMDELMHMVHSKARATPSGMMEYNESMDMDEDLGDRSVVKKARTAFPLGDPHRPPPNDIYRKRQVKKSSRA